MICLALIGILTKKFGIFLENKCHKNYDYELDHNSCNDSYNDFSNFSRLININSFKAFWKQQKHSKLLGKNFVSVFDRKLFLVSVSLIAKIHTILGVTTCWRLGNVIPFLFCCISAVYWLHLLRIPQNRLWKKAS